MGRGRDGRLTGNMDSARRRRSRRTAAARVLREQRQRLRAAERKHTRKFLSSAVSAARRHARGAGWDVQIERADGPKGWRRRLSWTQATIELAPVGISVQFNLSDKRGSSSSNTIHVRLGRELVRPCPMELLQSGDRRAFVEWLEESLRLASERSRAAAK